MTIRDQVRTAFASVGRRKLRSALASLGVVVGTLTIVIMVSLASGVRQQINRQFESIGLDRITVTPGGERRSFNPSATASRKKLITTQDVEKWKKSSGFAKVLPEINLSGSIGLELKWNDTNQPVRISGGDFRRSNPLFQEPPKALAASLELPESGGIILSHGAALSVGISSNDFTKVIGQKAEAMLRTSRGETQSFALRIHGIYEERSRTVQISVSDRLAMKNWWFNSTNTLEREGYDSVVIRANDVTRARELTTQLKSEGFQVQSLEMFVEMANRIVTAITVMFTLIGSIALLVATIGIANTMVMAIYERTREIGILKAMGASRREIRQMFMMEAGFIGLIGGVVGLLLGWVMGLGLNVIIRIYMTHRELPMHGNFFVVTLGLAIGAILFATFIGLVAGLLPAQRAAKLDPLEALRHE
jgi:putative ABC transport system permease protein